MIAQVKSTALNGIIVITCPECDHSALVADKGWSAILCQGCRSTLFRDADSAKEGE
jgi:ribosomal protein S27E